MTSLLARLRRTTFGLLATGALAACGGVGQDGTGAVPNSQTTGVINGFGSVIVDGIRYDVGSAAIRIDGVSGKTQADLRVGMVVTVTGALAADGRSGTAQTVDYESLLDGSVEQVLSGDSLRVLGQHVQVDATTVYTGASGAGELRAGDRLQVSGFRAPDGSLRATWVQRESGAASPRLAGFTAAVSGSSVRVGGLDIDVSSARLVDVSLGTLAVGQFVRATLSSAPAGGAATATELRLIDLRLPDTVLNLQVHGFVDDWNAGNGRFTLNGRSRVQLDAATQFVDGTLADIANGRRVEVKGRIGLDRVLRAERVRFMGPLFTGYARGTVASVDTGGERFVMLSPPGVEVQLRDRTLLNENAAPGGAFRLAELQPGDEVLVVGRDNGNRIDADLVQRLPRLTPGAGIGGPVSAVAGFSLTVLGVTVSPTVLTTYHDAQGNLMSQTAFHAALRLGDLVRAEGVHIGGGLRATAVHQVR